MENAKRFDLIARNTAEVLTRDDLSKKLEEQKQLASYLGIACTGPFHLGYLVPLGKLFDFAKAGVQNKVLLADVHAALDDLKSKWDELEQKAEYYKKCVSLAFPWDEKPMFVQGSSFQLKSDYQLDVLKFSTQTTIARATRAASEVTRMKNPKVSELIYPIMQALDEEYLKVDIQLGGHDQRHIMAFAREYLPILGYQPRVEVMTPLVVSLKGPGVKMSASIPDSSIKVYESEESVRAKIAKAYCPTGVVADNPVLNMCKYVLFPLHEKIMIKRDKKFGGDRTFVSYLELEQAFGKSEVHPLDLKNTVADGTVQTFRKVRAYFEKHQDMLKGLGPEFV